MHLKVDIFIINEPDRILQTLFPPLEKAIDRHLYSTAVDVIVSSESR